MKLEIAVKKNEEKKKIHYGILEKKTSKLFAPMNETYMVSNTIHEIFPMGKAAIYLYTFVILQGYAQ